MGLHGCVAVWTRQAQEPSGAVTGIGFVLPLLLFILPFIFIFSPPIASRFFFQDKFSQTTVHAYYLLILSFNWCRRPSQFKIDTRAQKAFERVFYGCWLMMTVIAGEHIIDMT